VDITTHDECTDKITMKQFKASVSVKMNKAFRAIVIDEDKYAEKDCYWVYSTSFKQPFR
jgi:hypothetical protein